MALPEQIWILVTEWLPEENQKVWVTKEYHGGDRRVEASIFRSNEFELENYKGVICTNLVKAWMPRFIPEPYKKETLNPEDSEKRDNEMEIINENQIKNYKIPTDNINESIPALSGYYYWHCPRCKKMLDVVNGCFTDKCLSCEQSIKW